MRLGNKMGYSTALDFAELDLDRGIAYHLTANHYPPVPLTMVPICIEAIDAYWEDNIDKLITLPEGVLWRNQTEAPAWSIIEAHHLSPWLVDSYDEEE
jgi:hypothetical protein